MNVVHVTNPNTVPFGSMSANTVYVFPSGTHYLPNNVSINKPCIAFISSGDTTISTNYNYNISVDNTQYIIFDKININANNIGIYGLQNVNVSDTTLHNMDVYNAKNTSVFAKSTSTLYLDTINAFNNSSYGIHI
jgi:hypothetical protein